MIFWVKFHIVSDPEEEEDGPSEFLPKNEKVTMMGPQERTTSIPGASTIQTRLKNYLIDLNYSA
jgi:hypothetical protein